MVTHGLLNQHPALTLDNGVLRVVVLPQKSADIYALIHIASGVDFLLKTPDGLRPPTGRPPTDFLENYEGGWQVMLPNADDACQYLGRSIPFHGDVALLPWDILDERDDVYETAVRLAVFRHVLPLRLERRLRMRAGATRLEIEDKITNIGVKPVHFVWGQHLVLGGDFLEGGCRLESPAQALITLDQLYEPETACLAAGQHVPWPLALGRAKGSRVDLRAIPGPDAHTHDEIFLTDLEMGCFTLTNPRRRLKFRLDWDAAIFRYLMLWAPYGGADRPPLTGIYGIGLEPRVSRFNLEQALRHDEALKLDSGASIETILYVTVELDHSFGS